MIDDIHLDCIYHYEQDASGVHLRGMSTTDGTLHVTGRARELREALRIAYEQLHGLPVPRLTITKAGEKIT